MRWVERKQKFRRMRGSDFIETYRILGGVGLTGSMLRGCFPLWESRGPEETISEWGGHAFQTEMRRNFFSLSEGGVNVWNWLPQRAVEAESLSMFKAETDRFLISEGIEEIKRESGSWGFSHQVSHWIAEQTRWAEWPTFVPMSCGLTKCSVRQPRCQLRSHWMAEQTRWAEWSYILKNSFWAKCMFEFLLPPFRNIQEKELNINCNSGLCELAWCFSSAVLVCALKVTAEEHPLGRLAIAD